MAEQTLCEHCKAIKEGNPISAFLNKLTVSLNITVFFEILIL